MVDDYDGEALTLRGERDLGYMLRDIAFVADEKGGIIESSMGRRVRAEPCFQRFVMRDGIIEVPPLNEEGGVR